KLENLGADAPEWAAFFAEALVQFQSGRPRDCDRTLAAAEDSVVRRSIEHSPQNPVLNQLSIAIRSVRADLHALDGDFIKAARCHGFAGRYIPRADFALRWHHASQEARYYELSAYYESAPTGLDNAARTLTSAIAALPAGAPAVMRACAQANLARILMFLGEKEQQNDRFQLAAQLLRDAGVAFAADEADESGRAAVNCLLADALARLGESYSDPGLLEQAIHHYQSAYARPHEPAMADDEMTHDVAFGLRARHAIALISYAEITSNNDLHSGAIAAINDELPAILSFVPDFNLSGYARTIVAARCHRALAGWFESRGDEASATTHHTEAAAEYERVGFDAPALWIRQAAGLPPAPQRSLDALTRNATSPRPASGNSKADAA
ncbi:MAG: hypothetical protein KKB37_12685, partial [Alphaproteobacteria bacterium]|nr:hypothetical protein [Alphaproteobacteria bacterium]